MNNESSYIFIYININFICIELMFNYNIRVNINIYDISINYIKLIINANNKEFIYLIKFVSLLIILKK